VAVKKGLIFSTAVVTVEGLFQVQRRARPHTSVYALVGAVSESGNLMAEVRARAIKRKLIKIRKKRHASISRDANKANGGKCVRLELIENNAHFLFIDAAD
jgi:ADP-ribose pyrophosphatase YjhB (NUDIX family)